MLCYAASTASIKPQTETDENRIEEIQNLFENESFSSFFLPFFYIYRRTTQKAYTRSRKRQCTHCEQIQPSWSSNLLIVCFSHSPSPSQKQPRACRQLFDRVSDSAWRWWHRIHPHLVYCFKLSAISFIYLFMQKETKDDGRRLARHARCNPLQTPQIERERAGQTLRLNHKISPRSIFNSSKCFLLSLGPPIRHDRASNVDGTHNPRPPSIVNTAIFLKRS